MSKNDHFKTPEINQSIQQTEKVYLRKQLTFVGTVQVGGTFARVGPSMSLTSAQVENQRLCHQNLMRWFGIEWTTSYA